MTATHRESPFWVKVDVEKICGPVHGAIRAVIRVAVVETDVDAGGGSVPAHSQWQRTEEAGPNPNSASGAQQLSN